MTADCYGFEKSIRVLKNWKGQPITSVFIAELPSLTNICYTSQNLSVTKHPIHSFFARYQFCKITPATKADIRDNFFFGITFLRSYNKRIAHIFFIKIVKFAFLQPCSQGLSSLPPLVVGTETAGHVTTHPKPQGGWSRDQPQPGSLFQRLREAEKRDPGKEVGFSLNHFSGTVKTT